MKRRHERERKGHARKSRTPVTYQRLMQWIVIWLHMCLYPRSSIDQYWSTSFPDSFIKSCGMTREDWVDIHVALFHLEDDIIELIEKGLNESFRAHWNPAQRVVIDESIRRFKGILSTLCININ